jgi:putative phosphoribosyl transferase
VLELNRDALERLAAHDKRLVVVPGATHLFEEPGTLDEAARLAADWFLGHCTDGERHANDERANADRIRPTH